MSLINTKKFRNLSRDDIMEMALEAKKLGVSTYQIYVLELINDVEYPRLDINLFTPRHEANTDNVYWMANTPFLSPIISQVAYDIDRKSSDNTLALVHACNDLLYSKFTALLEIKHDRFIIQTGELEKLFDKLSSTANKEVFNWSILSQLEDFMLFTEKDKRRHREHPCLKSFYSNLKEMNQILFYGQNQNLN